MFHFELLSFLLKLPAKMPPQKSFRPSASGIAAAVGLGILSGYYIWDEVSYCPFDICVVHVSWTIKEAF